jgi:ubiquinone biosynthesis protein
LQDLGPIFSAFARYLSTRPDLLPVPDCLELAAIPDQLEATPIETVRNRFESEIGRPLKSVFATFEESPFESRLLFQKHRARQSNGPAVEVRILHPELETSLRQDLPLLSCLTAAFKTDSGARFPIQQTIEDFQNRLRHELDFTRQAEALSALAIDQPGLPTVYPELCGPHILTLQSPTGWRLDGITDAFDAWELASQPIDLAQNLCSSWLKQAFQHTAFPADPSAKNLVHKPDGKTVYTGALLSDLSPGAKTNLWNYLLAVARHDPDVACTALLREMQTEQGAIDPTQLQHRFRQAVPFRDGSWSQTGDANSLAEHLFVQWRFAGENGYRPPPHLIAFFRGLFLVSEVAHRLAPNADPLLDGLEALRQERGQAQIREMLDVNRWGDYLGQGGALLAELPKKLDEVLTIAAEGKMQVQIRDSQTTGQRRKKNATAATIALLLMLVSVALLSHALAEVFDPLWVNRIGAIAFVCIGALLLKTAGKRQ